jgi:amino-acid N-acetyltransferase
MIRAATSKDFASLCNLLEAEHLPTIDLHKELPHFFLKTMDDKIVGSIGLELYGKSALLRSMMVTPHHRNEGIASELIGELLSYAKKNGVHDVYLITNTAEEFFSRKGFIKINRTEVNKEILSSQEFNGLCPTSSAVMQIRI